ncbi:DNA polymerase III subunit epsilon [Thiomicrorhabdus xiamenensis]|uniref:DNA polymerase III subunit epsilon n=1 Tax=Thiomicrorhabdus xiamenensis TaxID=2739063 RepID=A0A7D4NKN7_9GAMM|nr:DNA polymerase III subunit epsilon [Thiomicrorhabdus xiamenensis]QKI89369.1 DNA polymerase III subunit epsilon [Thiomicrorhabdus xiamenensis]
MRQIFLDTETTGFNPEEGDRIIEIGAVELIKRRLTGNNYHQYINPERSIPAEAIQVHGITDERVKDEPKFAEVVDAFMQFVEGAELIIHNAPFDVGFINHELSMLPNNRWGRIEDHCLITDSLKMASKMYPGQRNNLDALCRRLYIDNSSRTYHGALLDSEILADVYLAMTGGQTALSLDSDNGSIANNLDINIQTQDRAPLKVIHANSEELARHQDKLAEIAKKSGKELNW